MHPTKNAGKRATCAALMLSMLLGGACSKNPAPSVTTAAGEVALDAAEPLVAGLVTAVPGVSKQNAALIAGSLLGLARMKLAPGQYSQVAAALPGSDQLVNLAQTQGLPASASGLSSVTQFLGSSGVSASQVSQIAAALGTMLAPKLSPDVATALQAALR